MMPAAMCVLLGFQVGALVLGAGAEPRSVRIKGLSDLTCHRSSSPSFPAMATAWLREETPSLR